MKTQHTPGPWRVNHRFIQSGPQAVARTCGVVRDDKEKANARLISAAPDMLEALEAFMSEWTTTLKKDYAETPLGTVAKMAEAAITKATHSKPGE